MPVSLRNEYRSIKAKTRAPFITYLGLTLVVLFVAWIAIAISADSKKHAEMISKPQSGDIYEMKISDHKYTIYKVDRLTNDSVYLFPGLYEVDRISGIADLEKSPAYSIAAEAFSLQKLKKMLEEKKIIGIERK